MRTFLVLFMLTIVTPVMASEVPGPFKTDYCTNFPEGTDDCPELWKHCCLIHDMHMWAGGTKKDRKASDQELKSCITAAGAPKTAAFMYMGVKIGSLSPIKYADKKWNHGWATRPTFQKLTLKDINLLRTELAHESYEYIPEETKQNFIATLLSRLD